MIIYRRPDSYLNTASILYKTCRSNPIPSKLPPMPLCLVPSLKCIYWGARIEYPEFEADDTVFLAPQQIEHSAVIGTTGGKDSLAVALILKDAGYKLVMVHVRGVNPAYPTEARASLVQARLLKAIHIEVKVSIGKKEYVENPARNHAILLIQASIAAKLGAGIVAQGLHEQRVAANQPFETGWSDCTEMAIAGREMIQEAAPWLENRIDGFPKSDTESIDCVAERAPDMLPLVQSCMTTARQHARKRAESCRAAGYQLLPGRCGACYKCCREWLVLRQHGFYQESAGYREYVERLLVEKHAPFCYGDKARTWGRDKILGAFLSRPSLDVVQA